MPISVATTAAASQPVATAMEGVQTALTERPDLVVLDLGLPDLDGRELAATAGRVTGRTAGRH